jgi:hypothetical protein
MTPTQQEMNPAWNTTTDKEMTVQRRGTATRARESRPSANPREAVPAPVEDIRRLVLERQQLRDRRASREELEANRLAIVDAQWRLSRAAIEAHREDVEAKAA